MLAGQDEIEPPPRPVQSSAPPSNLAGSGREPVFHGPVISTPDYGRVDRPRLVLQPETPIAEALERSQHERETEPSRASAPDSPQDSTPRRLHLDTEPEIAIPLAAYAEEHSGRSVAWGRISVALVIAAAVIGFLLLRYRDPAALQSLSTAARAQFATVAGLFHRSAPSAPAPATTASLSPSSGSAATQPAGAANLQPADATNSTAAPPPPSAAPPSPSAAAIRSAAPAKTPAQSADTRASYATELAAARASLASAGDTGSSAASDSDEASRFATQPHAEAEVAIPASQMRNNLISSRIPLYPQGAHGTVVVQAIVTANGTVQPVRAVSGDPDLRDAAMAAVEKWHYRPYLLNGVPVNVSTTIAVNDAGDY